MKQTKVIIDANVNIYYAGFYIQGLFDKFGRKHVVFKSEPFKNIKNRSDNLNFIVLQNGNEIKYSIHFDDPYDIKDDFYQWCDVYGNVNANFNNTPFGYSKKLISLAPSFGIRLWGFYKTVYYCISNLLKIDTPVNIRKFIGKYRRQFQLRLPLKYYQPVQRSGYSSVGDIYIFHLSTLWQSDEWSKNNEGVNKARANFIRACKTIGNVRFEGGLSFKQDSSVMLFSDVLYTGTMSMKEYIEKTKKSLVVFNTPAFWNCHGWKLGEYLALGKAIISTPLSNDLPAPLIHGKNIHYVENDEKEIKNAVMLIIKDDAYRQKLEKGACEYWEKYGSPLKSLMLLGL